jgi:glutathione S-transferase
MTNAQQNLIKLFQFPRMFGVPNISPFCCKLETWLRMTGIPYEVVDTPDPRKGPKAKVPFIVDGNQRLGDSTLIIEHLKKTRRVDPDAWLDERQRATALLVQRAVEEHYAFIILYTHFIRHEGWRHTRAFFDSIPALVRPLVIGMLRRNMRSALYLQGTLRHSDEDIMAFAIADWRAILSFMSSGPYFFGERPSGIDAALFGALATTLMTHVQSPVRDFLRTQPKCVAYAERTLAQYFPELAAGNGKCK